MDKIAVKEALEYLATLEKEILVETKDSLNSAMDNLIATKLVLLDGQAELQEMVANNSQNNVKSILDQYVNTITSFIDNMSYMVSNIESVSANYNNE